jgi:Fe-S cluster biogenesis protein NfuA
MPLASAIARRVRSGVRRRVDRLLDRVGLGADAPPHASPPPADSATVTPQAAAPAPSVDEVGPPLLTRDEVEALFEDMVRPALQSDGGDITLIKVDANDVYVRLLGACETCPSAIVTMQMGIERLLQEEFPHFGRLIRVDDPLGHEQPFGNEQGA